MFEDKVVVITGGAAGIGKCIAEEFRKAGAHVCVIDCAEGDHYVGDIAEQATLEDFARGGHPEVWPCGRTGKQRTAQLYRH